MLGGKRRPRLTQMRQQGVADEPLIKTGGDNWWITPKGVWVLRDANRILMSGDSEIQQVVMEAASVTTIEAA